MRMWGKPRNEQTARDVDQRIALKLAGMVTSRVELYISKTKQPGRLIWGQSDVEYFVVVFGAKGD